MSHLSRSTLTALLQTRAGAAPLPEVLQRLVEIAREALPGADAVSTTLVRGDQPYTASYAGQMAMDADEVQYERGYGPCIEAGTSGTLLHVEDMRTETRWPDFATRVLQHGVLSSLSVPLPLQTDVVGALNCYASAPGAFAGEHDAAVELAGHIGVVVAQVLLQADAVKAAQDMRAAMEHRAVIEQAKGMVMAQNRCDADAAFAILSRASQARNTKLRDLAQHLVAGASTPPA